MSSEKEKVLEMVADGTVSAAEGVKLLEALGFTNSGQGMGRASVKRKIVNARGIINEIGPMLQATVGDVFKGRKSFEAFESIDLEEVAAVSEEMQEGQILVIYGNLDRGKNISISLFSSENNILHASLDNDSSIKFGSRDNKKYLLSNSGELRVQVPDCVAKVTVFSRGGGINSTGVRVPVELKTMGGGVNISEPGDKFSIKTMGGGLDITLDPSWKGNSKAKTMGGRISIHLLGEVPIRIDAKTLGGSISVGGNNPEIISDSDDSSGKSKISVLYGSKENPSTLAVTSLGGGIEITEKTDE